MRTIAAIAAVSLAWAMLAAPASAAPAPETAAVHAPKAGDVPAGICLFSINGDRVNEAPHDGDAHDAHEHDAADRDAGGPPKDAHAADGDKTAERVPSTPPKPQPAKERVCNTRLTPPVSQPLG